MREQTGAAPLLEVRNLTVSYQDFTLHPISFTVERGEIVAVAGESGSGKTTLLRGRTFSPCRNGSAGHIG